MKVQWRFCREAEREHEESERQYAHTFHYPGTICVCHAFWDLPKEYRDGVLLHEIGHLLAGPEGSEREATEAAEEFFDVPIKYVDSPYGRKLERLGNMAKLSNRARRRRRNPEQEIPYGEWVPAHAVKFNADGTVSIMTEPHANPGWGRSGLSLPTIRSILKGRGIEISRDADADEYRVNYEGASEDTAYYTDDLDDAYLTGLYMSQHRPEPNRGRRRNVHYGKRGELEYVPQRLLPELMNLWHLSRTATDYEVERIDWTVDEFHNAHPELTHSQIFRDLNAMVEG